MPEEWTRHPAGYDPPYGTNRDPDAPYSVDNPKPRKKRIFMWTFLAIQAIFVCLVVVYLTESTGPSHHDLVQGCYNGAWRGLFKSQADCVKHYGAALNDAGHVGQGIGLFLVFFFWAAIDLILGIGRMVVLSSRRRR
jgi:hypothetical protein